jgi:hypothetical protein
MAPMDIIQGPWHETGRQLIDILSIVVDESSFHQVQGWVATGLAGLGMPPAAQSRLVAALANQLTDALALLSPVHPRILTLCLYSTRADAPGTQGLGFFIVNKPLQANRCLLEIYVYREPLA